MGERGIRIQAFVLYLINGIDTIREDLLLDAIESVAGHYCFEFHPEFVCKLPSFGEKLKADIGYLTVFIFAIYYEIVLVCHCFGIC